MRNLDYLIIGAGPTGLGAASQLKKLGVSSFLVFESAGDVGGLSASYRDEQGFSWDVGGHVLFSRNDAFIRLIDEQMGEDLLCHRRHARVRVENQWADYPFQDHVHQLREDLAQRCREDLSNAPGPGEDTHTFEEWIHHSFGDSISEIFMAPYNRKIWLCPLNLMSFQWVTERVSTAGRKADSSSANSEWGANSTFFYPRQGGIGTVFRCMAEGLEDHLLFRQEVVSIDITHKVVTTRDGSAFKYEVLLSTAPLSHLIKEIIRPDSEEIVTAAERLCHNSISVVGIGVDAVGDTGTSWTYFPGSDCPFYRLTNLHNYSPDITPSGNGQSALLAEIALPAGNTPDSHMMIKKTIEGLIATDQLGCLDKKKIISTWHYQVPYGYPVPTLTRDEALSTIHHYLEQNYVYSRGRFGGWKYEIGNMDHSVMQGVEWANRMIQGKKEDVFSGKTNDKE